MFWKFLLTHPVWDVTKTHIFYINNGRFLLTHPVWDVTQATNDTFIVRVFLLTHPVWDVTGNRLDRTSTFRNFYSHIPCGMWRFSGRTMAKKEKFLLTHPVWDVTIILDCLDRFLKFLLTHPVWDVTGKDVVDRQVEKFLLTHPVWDVTARQTLTTQTTQISTHTSRVGCDGLNITDGSLYSDFYSHIPCGMWLHTGRGQELWPLISTHTSRVGCDPRPPEEIRGLRNFYSHIPCGMWRWLCFSYVSIVTFLLTHPVWDVTNGPKPPVKACKISTHTSRVVCDLLPLFLCCFCYHFYSHIPCGMWQSFPLLH